jgi:prevent-host-death family protein
MRVVNVKELKARLSAYLREADRGEVFLVTDRGRVVARLAPPPAAREVEPVEATDPIARLVALGCRPPLRQRRAEDYRWGTQTPALPAAEVDRLLDESREDRA